MVLVDQIQMCLKVITTGISNRALSFIQQLLNFPTCYTSSYTQMMERNSKVPSPGWMGSHWSCTFLSSNACSSTAIGCGAVDYLHPLTSVYRYFKCQLLAQLMEGRAGISHRHSMYPIGLYCIPSQ